MIPRTQPKKFGGSAYLLREGTTPKNNYKQKIREKNMDLISFYNPIYWWIGIGIAYLLVMLFLQGSANGQKIASMIAREEDFTVESLANTTSATTHGENTNQTKKKGSKRMMPQNQYAVNRAKRAYARSILGIDPYIVAATPNTKLDELVSDRETIAIVHDVELAPARHTSPYFGGDAA